MRYFLCSGADGELVCMARLGDAGAEVASMERKRWKPSPALSRLQANSLDDIDWAEVGPEAAEKAAAEIGVTL